MAQTDKELSAEFIAAVKNSQWMPVNPEPVRSREELRADLREHLIAQTGSEALADLSISHLRTEADARVKLEAQLREDVARLDAAIARFRSDTLKILEPLEARQRAAQAALDAATGALDAARIARDSELNRGLNARRIEILGKLRGTEIPQGKLVPWREGGDAPQFPPAT